jgi:(E)-4-hydroxy-3-methylbut-2-enyl-diphosphate synthase
MRQSMGIRGFTPCRVSFPCWCRKQRTVFHVLPQDIQSYVRSKMPEWRDRYDGVERMTLAVMGCVVNGPGESKQANIGISLPGTGEIPVAPVYEDGEKTVTLRGDFIAEEFKNIINEYVARKYPIKPSSVD